MFKATLLSAILLSSATFFSQSEKEIKTENEIKTVLQTCLDIEEFQKYFHPEIPGRLPMVIMDDEVVPEVKGVIKFEEEVLFTSIEDLFFEGRDDYLVFEFFEINEFDAIAHFMLPIEGVYAKVVLEKIDGLWETTIKEIGKY